METGDLFATKGIEYLIVIGYLIILVGFWKLLARPAVAEAGARSPQRVRSRTPRWFALRDGFYFHQGHAWAVPGNGGVMTVGMDDFAQKLLGRPGSIDLPAVGARVKQGERGWEVEVHSKSIPMLSPVDGEVIAVNSEVLESPEIVCSDPYERGWLMKVRVGNTGAAVKNLLSGRLARSWIGATVENLRQLRAGELGILMPDGGIPVEGFVRVLSPDRWDEIARQLLLSD